MNNIDLVKILINNGKRNEAWDLLNQTLTADPKNEEAWLLAYDLAQDVKKNAILNRARRYLPPEAEIFKQSVLPISWLSKSEPQNDRRNAPNLLLIGMTIAMVVAAFGGISYFLKQNSIIPFSPSPATSTPTRRSTVRPANPPATITPRPTATNQLTDVELEYLLKIYLISDEYFDAFERLGSLNTEITRNSNLINYQPWIDDMLQVIEDLLTASYEMASASPVPFQFKSFQNLLIDLNDETIGMMRGYAEWLDHGDASKLRSALNHLQTMERLMEELVEEIDRHKNE